MIIKSPKTWLAKISAPERPGQLWQSDITYIETQEGWLYLAFTVDACSRRCIAHHCREDMLAELTRTTFKHAVSRQRPLSGLIHHSDRGSQYAADAFQQGLSAWGVIPSMSRKANPYDNALAESFVATLKTECFGASIPPTKAAAKLMVFDYIETFYNTRRRHSAPWAIARLRSLKSTGFARSARVVLAAAAKTARPALLSRSALAGFAVNNSAELFKSPETIRSNHPRVFNPQAKPLTSTNK
jgi:hypothetical protein